MVKQYQVQADPHKLRAYGIPLSVLQTAIEQGNQEVGASVIEMAEAEYRVHATGYIKNREDLETIPLGKVINGQPLFLSDVAKIVEGPQMRRGISELNGQGEVVGGIIVMRSGENAQTTIMGVKNKLTQLKAGLAEGVELVTVYDRSDLITAAVENLWQKLTEELLMVALACTLFLFHLVSYFWGLSRQWIFLLGIIKGVGVKGYGVLLIWYPNLVKFQTAITRHHWP